MNIHEYQAKALLRSYGAPVSDGRVVLKAEDAKAAAGEMDGPLWVIKAQIHAGGRGKGKFKEADAGEAGGLSQFKKPLTKPRRCWAAHWSHTKLAQPANRSTASTSKTVQALKKNCTLPCS